MQLHLEFLVDDLEATGARVLAAGATPGDCGSMQTPTKLSGNNWQTR